METAPAATAASTAAAHLGRRSRRGPAGPGRPARRRRSRRAVRRRSAAGRRSGGGVPGSVSRHTDRSSNCHEKLSATSRPVAAAARNGGSRRTRVDLVRMLKGFAPPTAPDDAPRQVVLALGVLVGVGVGAHGDVVAAPLGGAQFGPQSLDRVDLDHDLAARNPRPMLSPRYSCVGRAKQYTHAWLHPRYAVDRVPEGHLARRRHRVDDRTGVDVEELHARRRRPSRRGARHPLVGEERLPVALRSPARAQRSAIGGRIANVCSSFKGPGWVVRDGGARNDRGQH